MNDRDDPVGVSCGEIAALLARYETALRFVKLAVGVAFVREFPRPEPSEAFRDISTQNGERRTENGQAVYAP